MSSSYEIITKSLDRHNDYIQLYLMKDEGGEYVTDDRETITDFEMSGWPLNERRLRFVSWAVMKFIYKIAPKNKGYIIRLDLFRGDIELCLEVSTWRRDRDVFGAIHDLEHLIVYLNKIFERGLRRINMNKEK
jgi:hypothetical protein